MCYETLAFHERTGDTRASTRARVHAHSHVCTRTSDKFCLRRERHRDVYSTIIYGAVVDGCFRMAGFGEGAAGTLLLPGVIISQR